jgi:hypothetical protein
MILITLFTHAVNEDPALGRAAEEALPTPGRRRKAPVHFSLRGLLIDTKTTNEVSLWGAKRGSLVPSRARELLGLPRLRAETPASMKHLGQGQHFGVQARPPRSQ